MSAQDGGPAYPQSDVLYEDGCELVRTQYGGMTLRQYAAIKLRVPDSGTDWLDAMILQSKRDEFAGQALAGILAGGFADTIPHDDVNGGGDAGFFAYQYADAMLAARRGK